jgi:hypothetical protein
MVLALLGAVLLILRGLINDGMFLRTGTAP